MTWEPALLLLTWGNTMLYALLATLISMILAIGSALFSLTYPHSLTIFAILRRIPVWPLLILLPLGFASPPVLLQALLLGLLSWVSPALAIQRNGLLPLHHPQLDQMRLLGVSTSAQVLRLQLPVALSYSRRILPRQLSLAYLYLYAMPLLASASMPSLVSFSLAACTVLILYVTEEP